jgi:Helix-turn-helix.
MSSDIHRGGSRKGSGRIPVGGKSIKPQMSFAENIKLERKRLRLTQPEAAAALDLKPRTYWEYESGATEPTAIAQEGALARLSKLQPKV